MNERGKTPHRLIGSTAAVGLHFKSIRVFSFDDTRASDNAETEISGYLGLDLLRNLHFIIDYRDGLIHFDNGQRPK